ncbi:MAG: ATP-binding cassette domain-containing protein [Prevotella sp.]|nr:ATP-binding cassette domain-containing protein [Prevotella sp.]MBQ8701353.1 ATP-binding cassette domain-containing protein [Prevotella sp.]MBQ9652485.1 ATP-binding cassette domain-containing protein [Prevotella sp.]
MIIDYKNVNIYQEEDLVLSDVNFHVDDGEFIYIIGKVGSGKSTLLKTTYLEVDINEGEKAEVLGREIMKMRRRDIPALRKEMGIIFQDFKLLHDRTVHKNLRFVLRATGWKKKQGKEIEERIDEVLKAVGMEDKKKKMPHELSGGEQQRIAIARAILNKPKVILADEPTGNLDPETAEHIVGLLKDISMKGTAVVITTHNINMIDKYPGIVYQCKDEKITEVTKDYQKMEFYEEEV